VRYELYVGLIPVRNNYSGAAFRGELRAYRYEIDPEEVKHGAVNHDYSVRGLLLKAADTFTHAGYKLAPEDWQWSADHEAFRRMATKGADTEPPQELVINGEKYRLVEED
jgi:hypothetical protein